MGTVLRVHNHGGYGFEFVHIGSIPKPATWFDPPSAGNTNVGLLGYASETWYKAAKKFNFKNGLPTPFIKK